MCVIYKLLINLKNAQLSSQRHTNLNVGSIFFNYQNANFSKFVIPSFGKVEGNCYSHIL